MSKTFYTVLGIFLGMLLGAGLDKLSSSADLSVLGIVGCGEPAAMVFVHKDGTLEVHNITSEQDWDTLIPRTRQIPKHNGNQATYGVNRNCARPDVAT